MNAEQQAAELRAMVRTARSIPNGELKEIEARLEALEALHGVTSSQLQQELAQGKRAETWEICDWLMLISKRDLLIGSQQASAS